MIQKMNTFQAMVLDKVNDQTNLEIKQLSIEDLPKGEVTIRVAYSSVNFKDGLVAIQNPIQNQLVTCYPFILGDRFSWNSY